MTTMDVTTPKPFVFVLMPFKDEFRDVYEVGIKQACTDAGAYSERLDEQIFEERMLERIYNQIAKADVIVADLTGQNPNVFYEVGYAHALGKRTILLTQRSEDIPFDLKHYNHIIYGGRIAEMKKELETRVRWMIANPREAAPRSDGLQFYVHGEPIEPGSTVLWNWHAGTMWGLIDVYNVGSTVIAPKEFRLGLVPSAAISSFELTGVQLPSGKILYHLPRIEEEIFPDGWASISFSFEAAFTDFPMTAVLKVFSGGLRREIEFQIDRL